MHIAQNWRLNGQRYAMKGVRCETCQKVIFPPREVCPYCGANLKAVASIDLHADQSSEAGVLQRAAR